MNQQIFLLINQILGVLINPYFEALNVSWLLSYYCWVIFVHVSTYFFLLISSIDYGHEFFGFLLEVPLPKTKNRELENLSLIIVGCSDISTDSWVMHYFRCSFHGWLVVYTDDLLILNGENSKRGWLGDSGMENKSFCFEDENHYVERSTGG